jgi:hypothetical protein
MRDKENLKQWRRENYLKNRERIRAQAKQSYLKNRDTILAKQKEYAEANRDACVERATKWRKTKPERNMWLQARKRAANKGLEFTIDVEDIVLPTVCPYLGIELKVNTGKGFQPDSYSLDRIDSSKGYVKGNIGVISNMANSMKRDATPEQLINFATSVLERFK